MSVTDESPLEVRFSVLEEKVKASRESFITRMDAQDKALSEIKEILEKLKPKPTDWMKIIGLLVVLFGILVTVFTAVVYPIRRDMDAIAKTVDSNRDMAAKDLSLIRAEFDGVKREMVWQWDGVKVRLENQTKNIDRLWRKIFGGEPENGK
jgi:nucleoside recognition membrane protein YjiH